MNALAGAGYPPLAAMVLAARGVQDPRQAHAYLDCNAPLSDPFAMKDMDLAVGRVALALSRAKKWLSLATMTWTALPPPAF